MARRAEDGFTIVEAMVAVTVLAVGIVLTMQPLLGAMHRVNDARVVLVAENLAQAEVEAIRALDYGDVGLPGRTPSGVLTEDRTITVEGRDYQIEVDIRYAGSFTGLTVVPQGGDGVQGSWDPGVDYKMVVVTVTAEGRDTDPVVMETIVAPRQIGAHEGIANARVYVVAYEPFASGGMALPILSIQNGAGSTISSAMSATEQVFPAIPTGSYTVILGQANGWVIHPDDVVAGLTEITAVSGTLVETTLRVYRPATLIAEVVDASTGSAIADARFTLNHLESGRITSLDAGVYTAEGLLPGAYDISVTAADHLPWSASSLNVPAGYPDPVHLLTVAMEPIVVTTTTSTTTTTVAGSTTTTTVGGTSTTTSTSTTTTLAVPTATVLVTVRDNTNRVVNGATVTAAHPSGGETVGYTDSRGEVLLTLEAGVSYTVTASTDWGHGPKSGSVTPGSQANLDLKMTRPSGKGTMVLKGGEQAEFLYREVGISTWKVMPSNYLGEASFVGYAGTYDVAKRCLANGAVLGQRTASVAANRNRSVTIRGGTCP